MSLRDRPQRTNPVQGPVSLRDRLQTTSLARDPAGLRGRPQMTSRAPRLMILPNRRPRRRPLRSPAQGPESQRDRPRRISLPREPMSPTQTVLREA